MSIAPGVVSIRHEVHPVTRSMPDGHPSVAGPLLAAYVTAMTSPHCDEVLRKVIHFYESTAAVDGVQPATDAWRYELNMITGGGYGYIVVSFPGQTANLRFNSLDPFLRWCLLKVPRV